MDGVKPTLELGNNLSRALTSELAMLATPETIPLFLRKYQQKRSKQYRRREPKRRRENFTPPFIHLLQHRMLKSPKAAVFSADCIFTKPT